MEEATKVDVYVGDKKVVSVTPVEETTPTGDSIYKVTFEDGTEQVMTNRRFQLTQSLEKSDASAARQQLVKSLGKQVYTLLMEHGLLLGAAQNQMGEIDLVFNEAARLVNDGQAEALNILWGNDIYERSLLDINRVLFTKYGETPEETGADTDAAPSEGGSVDTENKD